MTNTNELMETFEKNSSELYWLAYLLSGNEDRGVQAFDRALDLDLNEDANPAFDGFMTGWARKLIVTEALGTIRTVLRQSIARVARTPGEDAGEYVPKEEVLRRPAIRKEQFEEAVIAIDAFPRCAMLLTIFEGLPVKTAADLLHADEALTAAAQRIGIVQLTRNLAGNTRDPHPDQGHAPVPALSLG